MYKKIFIKEFMGNKKNLIMLFIIMSAIFTIVGVQIVFLNASKITLIYPDVEIKGASSGVDGSIPYSLYRPIDELYDKWSETIEQEDISSYKSIRRSIISIESGLSMNKVMYTVEGLEEDYINSELNNYVTEGRLPQINKNEVLIGSHIKHAFQFEVGDMIGKHIYKLASIDGVGLPISLEESVEELYEYKITGILDDTIDYFQDSIIVPYNFEGGIKPNVMFLYFNSKQAGEIYKNSVQELRENNALNQMGSVSEHFHTKQSMIKQIINNLGTLITSALIIIYLVISYLVKGLSKKIGILKALGMKDKVIIKIFLGGLLGISAISLIISESLVFLLCYVSNKDLSEFLGFETSKYKITANVIMSQGAVAAILAIAIFGIIKYKTSRISPKESINIVG